MYQILVKTKIKWKAIQRNNTKMSAIMVQGIKIYTIQSFNFKMKMQS